MESTSPQAATPSPNSAATRPRKPRYSIEVRSVERLTPRMARVTFAGRELATFASPGPASHVKLIFGAAETLAPEPEGTRPVMRTYTPRRFDREACEIDVDFVIHGEGPASAWAAQAAAGQRLTLAGPGRSYAVDSQAPWYVLAGDETAIPAIGTILESLPAAARAMVHLEVVDSAEEHAFTAREAHTEVHWCRRGADPRNAGRALEAAVRGAALPDGAGRIYVACESDAMRRIRRHLLAERQFPRDRLVTRGYWRLGETDHPDRDYGEDIS